MATTKMADGELPWMSREEEGAFINMWECFRCLWDPHDPKYKNRAERKAACREMARLMQRPDWTEDQVYKKMRSLRAIFNKVKRRKGFGTAGDSRRRWCHFDRLASFLPATECYPSDSLNTSPEVIDIIEESQDESSSVSVMTLPNTPSSDHAYSTMNSTMSTPLLESATPTRLTRTAMIPDPSCAPTHPVTIQWVPEAAPEARPPPVPSLPQPPPARPAVPAHHHTPSSRFTSGGFFSGPLAPSGSDEPPTSAIVKITPIDRHSKNKQHKPSQNTVFARNLASKLDMFKSIKRVMILQHRIDTMVHEALMEDMESD